MADRRSRWLKREWERDPHCRYCLRLTHLERREDGIQEEDEATCDHYVPLGKQGPDIPSNWRLSCRKCNDEKGDQWPEIWLGEAEGVWVQPLEEPHPSALAIALSGIVARA